MSTTLVTKNKQKNEVEKDNEQNVNIWDGEWTWEAIMSRDKSSHDWTDKR